jgi:toxin ParE1/3/4
MAELIWTEHALNELYDLAEYIELMNPIAAKKFVKNTFESIERLQESPFSGRMIPELGRFHYREVITKTCRIFYRVDEERIYIINVMRQEREIRRFISSSSL